MQPYVPASIEKKKKKYWDEHQAFAASADHSKPKFYGLIEFPYPSGHGLHVGHPRSNTAMDIIARKRRMQGYNVLFPIGWHAFGLPTENYAIKNNIHPAVVTKQNVDHFRQQLKKIGFSFDYSREVDTTDPKYYHRPGLLQMDPVDLPENVRTRPGVPGQDPGELLPQLQGGAVQ